MQAFSLQARQGRELEKLLPFATELRRCNLRLTFGRSRAPVPPVPLGPRKFPESANSYLTQKVVAQLLGYGRGCLWSSGDLRRPFVHELPLCVYTVQCTPSAKESESRTLQSPSFSLHGSHTCLHRSGKESEGERSKIREQPERLALSTLRLWTASCSWLLSKEIGGTRGGAGQLRRALSAALWSPG